jgi:hypothetical protein
LQHRITPCSAAQTTAYIKVGKKKAERHPPRQPIAQPGSGTPGV